jgi:hypothetical protein
MTRRYPKEMLRAVGEPHFSQAARDSSQRLRSGSCLQEEYLALMAEDVPGSDPHSESVGSFTRFYSGLEKGVGGFAARDVRPGERRLPFADI